MKNNEKTRKFKHKDKNEKRRLVMQKQNARKEMNVARYGADGGSALVMAKTADLNRRLMAAFLALVFAISTMVIGLNFVTSAEDPAPTANTKSAELESNLVLDKYITPQEDGTYDLTLSAFAKGTIKNTTTQVPTDFIFVVDQSGSMSYEDMPLEYVAVDKETWTIRDIQPQYNVDSEKDEATPYYYYDEETGDYYRVYAKWGPMYELVPRQSLYLQALIDRSGLSWFRSAGEQTQEFDSMYYYQPSYDPLIGNSLHPDRALANDNHFYPLTMSVQNAPLYYYMTFAYKDINGTGRNMRWYYSPNEQDGTRSSTNNAIFYYNPLNSRDPDFGPGDRVALLSYNFVNQAIVYAAGQGSNPVVAVAQSTLSDPNPGFYYRYTYAELGDLTTGMYVQNPMFIGHVGYNQLCYRDSNGVERTLIKTDYCDENDVPLEIADGTAEANEKVWNGTLYTIAEENGTPKTETRLEALNRALSGFVNSVEQQAATYETDHRIAIVGFSSANNGSNNYNNNELLTVPITDGATGSMGTTPGVTSGYSLDGKTHNGALYSGVGSISDATYYSSLASTVSPEGQATLDKAVNSITAYGGTQPELGLEMAENIIRVRDAEEGLDTDRNTIVVFFTDGRPGNYATVNQYTEAGEVVAQAKAVKDRGATIYTIGVFNESDGNPLTYPENSSNGDPKYYVPGNSYIRYYKYDEMYDKYYNAPTCQNNSFGHNHIGANNRVRDEFTMDQTMVLLNNNKYFVYPDNRFIQEYRTDYVRKTEATGTFSYRWDWGTIQSHYSTATSIPYYRETFYLRDCKSNTANFPDQPNDTIADYMTVVSSTYPEATSFDGGWSTLSYNVKTNGNYNNTINTARGAKEATNYYMSASNANKLEEVFINIAGMETVPAIDTNASFVLQDVVSDSFHIELGQNETLADHVTLKVATGEQNEDYEYSFDSPTDAPQTVTAVWGGTENKTLTVSGFDYVGNFIAYGKPADYQGSGNLENQGKKLIVIIDGLIPNDDGVLPSNASGSSIIMQEPGEGDTIVSTPIEDFASPAITCYKYDLKVGDVHNSATFNVNYALTADTPEDESVVVRNATEAYRYDQLTNGAFSATALDGNQNRTTDVGNNATVYVEYISTQPSSDPAAPPVATPANYDLEASISVANSNTDANKYTYYLSDDHFLTAQNEQIPANELATVSPVSWVANTNKSLYVTSKTNNHTVTIKETVSGSFANDNDTFTPTVFLVPPSGTTVPASETYGSTVWTKDGNNNQLTTTLSAIRGNGTASTTITVPSGWTLVVKQTDGNYYEVESADYTVGETSGTYSTYDSSTGWSWSLTDNIEITIDNVRNNLPVEGVYDGNKSSTVLWFVLAGMVVASGGAGAVYVYRKKDEFVEE